MRNTLLRVAFLFLSITIILFIAVQTARNLAVDQRDTIDAIILIGELNK